MNGAQNAVILAAKMFALADTNLASRLEAYKEDLKQKTVKTNAELAEVKTWKFKTN